MITILFVCHGNICRSPMAEALLRELAARRGLAVRVSSAATSREEIGNGVHRGTRNILAEKGIPCPDHRAVQMTREDYARYDLLLGMDQQNLLNMRRIAGGDPDGKIRLLMSFTQNPREVADPWYTGDFEATWRDVLEGCEGLLETIFPGQGA